MQQHDAALSSARLSAVVPPATLRAVIEADKTSKPPASYRDYVRLACEAISSDDGQRLVARAFSQCSASKSPATAVQLKDRGNSEFRRGAISEAALSYTRSMRFAEGNRELAVLFANRAACWLRLGSERATEQALVDATTAVSLSPDYAKAWHRRASALGRLGLGDSALHDEALSYTHAKTRTSDAHSAVRSTAAHSAMHAIVGAPETVPQSWGATGERVKLTHSSPCRGGRGIVVVGEQGIEPGSLIAWERPCAVVPLAQLGPNARCVQCFGEFPAAAMIPCDRCGLAVMFCSQACRSTARGDDNDGSSLRGHPASECGATLFCCTDVEPETVLAVRAARIALKGRPELAEALHDLALDWDGLRAFDMFSMSLQAALGGAYGSLTAMKADATAAPSVFDAACEVMRALRASQINAVALTTHGSENSNTGPFSFVTQCRVGVALAPRLIACANHSCLPNSALVFRLCGRRRRARWWAGEKSGRFLSGEEEDGGPEGSSTNGPVVRLIALRHLTPGEECTISYGPHARRPEWLDIARRRSALEAQYAFICHCGACKIDSGVLTNPTRSAAATSLTQRAGRMRRHATALLTEPMEHTVEALVHGARTLGTKVRDLCRECADKNSSICAALHSVSQLQDRAALMLGERGDFGGASKMAESSIELLRDVYDEHDPEMLLERAKLATLFSRAGRRSEAQALAQVLLPLLGPLLGGTSVADPRFTELDCLARGEMFFHNRHI